MKAIETHKLSKFYGKFRGIEDVSLEVDKGEVFGFIGPNGAGKSTFIRTLLGLLIATEGQAKIMGENVLNNGAEIRQKIGYLPSEVNYYNEMNARELLNYSARFYENSDTSKIEPLAERYELDLEKKITDLSFGNKKKVAIIQSVLHSPEILILDEPTSGLDPLMQNRFFEMLEEEHEKGVTIFFSSHILSEIQRMCQRAAIIKEGKIIKIENIQDLMKKQMKKCRLVYKEIPGNIQLPDNAQNESWVDEKLNFEYVGSIQPLMQWIAQQDLVDVVVEEPTLENIFMNYYER